METPDHDRPPMSLPRSAHVFNSRVGLGCPTAHWQRRNHVVEVRRSHSSSLFLIFPSLPFPFPCPSLSSLQSPFSSPSRGGGQLLNPASGSGRVSSPSRSEQPAAKRFLVNFSPKITLLVTMILKRIAVNYTQTLITHTFEWFASKMDAPATRNRNTFLHKFYLYILIWNRPGKLATRLSKTIGHWIRWSLSKSIC